jgi:predicted DNA-binding transcriptional regulator YafY
MNRLDRALGILLLLRQGGTLSATDLAARFEVSVRTIYRDMETLGEIGAPIYAELGREGGFRLLEGYFLPPVMFTQEEASSLLLGMALLRRLRVMPFTAQSESAEHKLLAALPEQMRAVLARLPQLIGFEDIPPDLFHWGPAKQSLPPPTARAAAQVVERQVVGTFLRAIFTRKGLKMHYRSPYKAQSAHYQIMPAGLLWDRDWWYLVGHRTDQAETVRLWRADRVLQLEMVETSAAPAPEFDIQTLLGRTWLRTAMAEWINQAPVKLRITAQQAEQLQQDWYYRYATYEPLAEGGFVMTFGEDNPQLVLDLVRWLGPTAELLAPHSWRSLLRAELTAMLATYTQKP